MRKMRTTHVAPATNPVPVPEYAGAPAADNVFNAVVTVEALHDDARNDTAGTAVVEASVLPVIAMSARTKITDEKITCFIVLRVNANGESKNNPVNVNVASVQLVTATLERCLVPVRVIVAVAGLSVAIDNDDP